MRRRIPHLEMWFESTESLTEAERDLLELLHLLSAEAGQPDSRNAAVLAFYKIRRAYQSLTSRKRLAEKWGQDHEVKSTEKRRHDEKVKSTRQRQRGMAGWHVLLVRTKSYELGIDQQRRSQEEAAHLARQSFVDEQARRVVWKIDDLRPVEQRAVAILGGAPRNAKKSVLEKRAIKLAEAVKAEWFSPRGKQGRSAGSKMKLAGKSTPRLQSVAEVIEAIWPIIEQLAGPQASTSPESTMIKAIASAVRSSADLKCTLDLAANVVRALRRTSRSSTI